MTLEFKLIIRGAFVQGFLVRISFLQKLLLLSSQSKLSLMMSELFSFVIDFNAISLKKFRNCIVRFNFLSALIDEKST